ncbi:MAG TPA: phosphodiester glycosidase family protein [Tepidisphaeraceae bacterium]|nr:phosphodiester glycosidase family protein [Tepidisphaeraceae bacterium]
MARGEVPASQPSPIQYHQEIRSNPPLHLHVVTVDLSDPRVELKVARAGADPDGDGPWQTTLQTVRTIATRDKLDVAVNGNYFIGKDAMNVLGQKVPYFTGNWAMANGLAMSDGVLWSKEASRAAIVVDAKGGVSIGRFGKLPADARQVIGSAELLVSEGKPISKFQDIAPRTSVGIDRDKKRLTMLVIDGRRDDYSVGVNGPQLAQEMIRLGCWDAIVFDGGGSSTMVMLVDPSDQKIRLMNNPSDGHDLPISLSVERPVVDAFGVKLKTAATTKP